MSRSRTWIAVVGFLLTGGLAQSANEKGPNGLRSRSLQAPVGPAEQPGSVGTEEGAGVSALSTPDPFQLGEDLEQGSSPSACNPRRTWLGESSPHRTCDRAAAVPLAAGFISGTVTDTATALPLAGVDVEIYNSSGTYVTYGHTNSSGVYTTSLGLPSGTYYARTWNSAGYIEELYDGIACPGLCTVTGGTPIGVVDGSTTTGIDFALTQGGRISGTVTDSTTGLPVANLQVYVHNSSGSFIAYGYTNASGVYTSYSGLPSGTYYARTRNSLGYIEKLYNNVSCPGSLCSVTSGAPISVTAPSTTSGIDFALTPGGRIGGTVTDSTTGLPVANLHVYLFNSSGSFMTYGYTNASGLYTSNSGLPSGTYYARTWNELGYVDELYNNISCPGSACTLTSGTPIAVTLGTTTAGIDFALASGGRISGTLTSSTTGLPVANVQIRVYNSSGNQVTSGATDTAGVYTTSAGLPSGTYYARTSNSLAYVDELYNNIPCPGGTCTVTSGTPISVTAPSTTSGIDFALTPGGRIGGTVTSSTTGLPVANVQIRVYNSSGNQVTSETTDTSGVYTTSAGLPSGTYYARTWNELGYVEELYNNIPCPGGTCMVTNGTAISVTVGATTTGIDFALVPGGRISGTVTDVATGLPLASVQVRVYNSSGSQVTSGTSNSSGVYMTSSGLPSGTYYARTSNSLGYVEELYNNISCPGGTCTVTSGAPIGVTLGATTAGIDLALASGGRISGTVTDATTGLPLANVQVQVHNSSGSHLISGFTNASGVYTTSSGLPSGTYHARTWSSLGYVEELYDNIVCVGATCTVTSGTPIGVTAGATTAGIDFALVSGGRISGTVTDVATGLPLANVQVQVYNSSGGHMTSGTTNGSGVYATSIGLPPGTYYAATSNSLGYMNEVYDNIPCPGGTCTVTSGTAISVTVGATTTGIDFALVPGGRISGTVTDVATGLPLASVQVRVYNSSGSQVTSGTTNSSGVYTLVLGLLSGTYYARTSNSLGYIEELYDNISCPASQCTVTSGTPISVTAGTTTAGIDFGLALGGRISGSVTDATTGLPLASVSVSILDASGVSMGSSLTNSAGVFTTPGFPAGTFYARTNNSLGYIDELYYNLPCPGGSCSVISGTPISVTVGSTTSGIDFALVSGGRITGTVTDVGTAQTLASVQVLVYDSNGTYMTSGSSNSSGVYTTSSGLPSGTYYAVTNSPGYLDEIFDSVSCPGGVCTVTSGTPIIVTLGTTTSAIDFALASGGRISGTVTDAGTGLPLASQSVFIFDSSGVLVATGSTNSSGTYTSRSGLLAGNYYAQTRNSAGFIDEVYNNVACPGYSCAFNSGAPIPVILGGTTSGIDFALSPGGRVSGTVTDAATGLPLMSVTVDLHNAAGTYVGFGLSDIVGNYTSRTGLPTGTYYAKTRNAKGYVDELYDNLPCAGYGCTVTGGTPIGVTAGVTTGGINLGLLSGGRIRGQVTDAASGLPLSGVLVHVLNAAGDQLASAVTTSDGRYSVEAGLSTASYYLLTTNSAGYLDELHADVVCPSHLMLKEGIGLSGRRVPVPSCSLSSGVAVAVTVGSTTTVDFGLALGGRASGSVTGVGVGAIAGIKIGVFGAAGQWLGAGETDVVGFYRTPALTTGSYFLRTSNSSGWADELYDNIPCPGGSCSVISGTPVGVTVGGTASGKSFVLLPDLVFKDGFE